MGKVEVHRLQVKVVPLVIKAMAKKDMMALANFLLVHSQGDVVGVGLLVLVVEVVLDNILKTCTLLKAQLKSIIQSQTEATHMGKLN